MNGAHAAAPLAVREEPGGIRTITIDAPPANLLSFALCAPLVELLAAAEADSAVRAIVITGAGGRFSGGADIADFARPPTPGTRTLRDVVAALEASAKTSVAAIDGIALGGGCELALACDYRVATPRAQIGLPEIGLGLIPGAGGTQRLPRLLGANDALALMLGGKPIAASDAHARGIVDVIADDAVAAACAHVAALADEARKRRVSERSVALGVPGTGPLALPYVVAQAHAKLPPEERGGRAAHALVDAVQAALELPFAHGLAREGRLFDELLASPEHAALRHVFFAERQASAVAGLTASPRPLRRAGVVGAGTMGTGIALALVSAGFEVIVVEPDAAQIERAKATVFGTFAHAVKRGRSSADAAWDAARSLRWEGRPAALGGCDLVLEAIVERLDVKCALFTELGAACEPHAIFASNTSTLDIDAMAAASGRSDRFVGLHFFAPANIMKLLEVVRGAQTSDETLATALALAKRLKKTAIVARNAFGFVGNRMFFDYARETLALVEDGVAPERIDAVMRDFGMAMGPCAAFDLSGLDVFAHITAARPDALGAVRSDIIARLVKAGRLGQKAGRGFFRYAGDDRRTPLSDPAVDAIARDAARAAGIAPRAVDDAEIVERLVYALVNAGALLVERGIAQRPGDEDVAYVYGYGFPPHRGGPLWYADEVGAARVVARMRDFGWDVAPALAACAASGEAIATLGTQAAHA